MGLSRRQFLVNAACASGSTIAAQSFLRSGQAQAPSLITPDRARPQITHGIMSGDVNGRSAVIWSRCDRPAQLIVDYATTDSFRDPQRVVGSTAIADTDFTARVQLTNLPPGERIFYRVQFQDAIDSQIMSVPQVGQLSVGALKPQNIRFAWAGDTAGQGWGINPEWGGMRLYETIRRSQPQFFIHCGDTIYADNPLQAEVKLDDGQIWKNIVTPEKAKVAETLQEFRGNYQYNLLDESVRRFQAEVPQLMQWDDHEVRNNWYLGQTIQNDDRYTVKDVSLLAARAKQAFLEYTPIAWQKNQSPLIYRSFQYGPLLEVFMLDMRSYRAANSSNRQTQPSQETVFLGREQIAWLKQQLQRSRATWKAIASDMPLGLVVPDGKTNFEAVSNGDGPVLGREFEVADLLRFIKKAGITNVVWFTADVHYAAAHYYDPSSAQFTDFNGFWEFVAGPLHAGTFGPNALDNTFGPQVKYQSVRSGMKPNRPPSEGLQFFGNVDIDAKTQVMTVSLHDLAGKELYTVDLNPEMRKSSN